MLIRRLVGSGRGAAASTVLALLLLSACGTPDNGLTPDVEPTEPSVDGEDGEDGQEPGDLPVEQDRPADDVNGEQEHDVGGDTREDLDAGQQPREVAVAIADAAARSGVDPDDVEVVAFEEVTWPDGAMGCPQPGQMYTQALVEGYRVRLAVEGSELSYHGARGGDPTLCEDPQEPLPDQG